MGKTTILLKAIESLRDKGYSLGGMISREVRSGGTRVGFEILNLNGSKRGWLAHVDQVTGPQVGKYRVNLDTLESLGVAAIVEAVEKFDVIIIDEIGPMELFSERFKESVTKAVESGKLVVGVIHWKGRDELTNDLKEREDVELCVVTFENRGNLHESIVGKAVEFLQSSL